MDVRCGRCGTEYEFDDALISERGTTVKCTNCGHQFKVYPAQTSLGVPERWVVRTSSGRELVYTSLRDLQKGITQRQVGPEDMLSRGNQPARALSAIAELEPFFHGTPLHVPRQPGTLMGVAPPANPARSPSDAPAAPMPPHGTMVGGFNASATANMDLHAPGKAPGVVVPRVNASLSAAAPRPASVPPPRSTSNVDPLSATAPLDSETDPATIPRPVAVAQPPASVQRPPVVEPTPTPGAIREALRSYEDISSDATELPGGGARRARSRWIAAILLLSVAGLFGATLGRRYFGRFAKPPPATTEPAPDGRIAGMLEAAGRMLDQGDLEGAKEQLDKATGLGEKDPAVISALARLETIRADLYWLKLLLLDPSDQGLVTDTNQQLGRRIGKAREAVDRATQVSATDPMVIRARIDLLRLAREVPEARKLVGPLSQNASQPENAYVLAALDLAEPAPVWSSIIDRLRTASAAERELGRARAALIYALVRSGDVTQAKSELAKLESRAKSHPLLADLQSFVQRHGTPADAGTQAKKEVATVDPATLPLLETKGGPEPEARDRPGDIRTQLKDANAALHRGDLNRAEMLFKIVLAKHPGNTEALAGLGDVARQRKDTATADKMYEQALRDNPTYLPALVAQADHKWDSGDRKGAISIYRRVLEQAGAGSEYGQRAASRIAQGEGSSAKEPSEKPPTEKPPAEDKTPSEPAPEKKPDESPHIDTSDLPDLK